MLARNPHQAAGIDIPDSLKDFLGEGFVVDVGTPVAVLQDILKDFVIIDQAVTASFTQARGALQAVRWYSGTIFNVFHRSATLN